MDELTMNKTELDMWRTIGADLGYEFDEVGHPYKRGPARDIDGSTYHGAYDWRPMDDDADAFRLQVHYCMTLELVPGGVNVRQGAAGPLVHMEFSPRGPFSRLALARRAIFYGAFAIIALDPKAAKV